MNTLEKMNALITHLETMPVDDASPQQRDMVETLQIMEGLSGGRLGPRMLLPQTEVEADQQVDDLITLLLQLRGDDLPPYDFDRHVTDATAMEAGPAGA